MMALTGALLIYVQVKGKGALLNYWLQGRTGLAPPSLSQVGTGPGGSARGSRAVPTGASFSSAPFSSARQNGNRAPGSSAAPPVRSGSFLPQWLVGGGRGSGPAALRRPSPPPLRLLAAAVAPLEAARVVPAFSAGAADAIPAGDWLQKPHGEGSGSGSDSEPPMGGAVRGPSGPPQAAPQGGAPLAMPPPSGPPVLPPPEDRRSPAPGAAALAGDDLEVVEVSH